MKTWINGKNIDERRQIKSFKMYSEISENVNYIYSRKSGGRENESTIAR